MLGKVLITNQQIPENYLREIMRKFNLIKIIVVFLLVFLLFFLFNCANAKSLEEIIKTDDSNLTTIAGTAGTPGHADGTGTGASFFSPSGITADSTNLYIADTNNCTIRQISISSGNVTTIAGIFWTVGSKDDPIGTSATFNMPYGITTDGTNLYITDTYNCTIRQVVISSGAVTTIAGKVKIYGHTDASGTSATFYKPYGITTDGTNLYIADTFNCTIRQVVISSGAVTTIAGIAETSGHADGTGILATFNSPYGITTDGTNLYIADTNNFTIRQMVISSGVVTTIAGSAGTPGHADGTGATATFYSPCGITTDGTYLYVADTSNCTIRKIGISTGIVTTIAGSAGNTTTLYSPQGIALQGDYIYVSDTGNCTIKYMSKM
jgi:hypothetical protein